MREAMVRNRNKTHVHDHGPPQHVGGLLCEIKPPDPLTPPHYPHQPPVSPAPGPPGGFQTLKPQPLSPPASPGPQFPLVTPPFAGC